MVDQLKFENLDVFIKIENISKMCQETQGQIRESRLKPEFRPAPLTIETTFPEVKTFLRGFSTYIKSGEQSPGNLVFEVASNNVDSFFDSGASVCIMGEIMARESRLTIKRLSRPRNVHVWE